MRAAILGCPHK
ncbi:unnamed protein product, partial [Rotaria magnacalcarata]